MLRRILVVATSLVLLLSSHAYGDLLGYWSADTTAGEGEALINDQGNADLDGELIEAFYSDDGDGHTGAAGDFSISFDGFDEDYAVIPATDEEFESFTVTAWINGISNGDWAGIVVSRDPVQPLYLGFSGGSMDLAYVWNDNSNQTWGWFSDVAAAEDEWTFVALTITEEEATVFAGVQGDELEYNTNEIDHFPQLNVHEWRLAEDDGFGGTRNFSGLMDDISIWNEALTVEQLMSLHEGTETPLSLAGIVATMPGDYNADGMIDNLDADLQADAMADPDANLAIYDENGDGQINHDDRRIWVQQHAQTWYGDADLNGEFNSGDLVTVFTEGLYEVDTKAGWKQGDWNGDTRFGSGDLVAAFTDGGFEGGRRPMVVVVPEPNACLLLAVGFFLAIYRMRAHGKKAHIG